MTAVAARLRPHASAGLATVAGGVTFVLAANGVALTVITRDLTITTDGATMAICLVFAAVGVIVARRQPANPIGWLLIGTGFWVAITNVTALYAYLDWNQHGGSLPFGAAAIFIENATWALSMLVGMPAIALFPDGRVKSVRSRRVLLAYLAVSIAIFGVLCAAAVVAISLPPQDIVNGVQPSASTGAIDQFLASGLVVLAAVPFWLGWIVRQLLSFRRATGDARQQLKWFTAGAVVTLAGIVGLIVLGSETSTLGQVANVLATYVVIALPLAMGLAILKYRLYDIDRIISRTLSYAIVTGVLIGLYIGLVALVTGVLGFTSQVGVAASTLAAAALFSPLRRRVQHLVDRRFNRAHYNAEQTIAAFAARLQDAVDVQAVRADLVGVISQAVEPAHVSVWLAKAHRTP